MLGHSYRGQEIRIVRNNHGAFTIAKERITQEMCGQVYVGTFFLTLVEPIHRHATARPGLDLQHTIYPNRLAVLITSQDRRPDWRCKKASVLDFDRGEGGEGAQIGCLPKRNARIIGASLGPGRKIPDAMNGVFGEQRPEQGVYIEPLMGCPPQAPIIEIIAVDVDVRFDFTASPTMQRRPPQRGRRASSSLDHWRSEASLWGVRHTTVNRPPRHVVMETMPPARTTRGRGGSRIGPRMPGSSDERSCLGLTPFRP